jgi:hypothetical protein
MRGWVPLLVVLAWLWALDARAGERRYAVVIGANEGHRDEQRLLFAERDAERVADVLRRLGDFSDEDTVVLTGATADRALHVLDELGRRIERERGEDQALLFVYYSGHADHAALHLGDTDLPLGAIKQALSSAPATLRVLVVDACRSGEITRVKGAVPTESFEFEAKNELLSEGLAIITSSAAGEDAQESDRLGGGVFTHHLVNGLAGAADASADGRITLTEAYRYAYDQTLATTSRARFVQHPTYSFALKGREELVVTRLADDRGLGRLRLTEAGSYVVFSGGRKSEVVAELAATPRTDLLLVPGTYVVRRRDTTAVHEVRARVAAGQQTTVVDRDMTRVPYGTTVRKGYTRTKAIAGALTSSFELAGPFVPRLGLGYYPSLGLKLDLRQLALHPHLRYGYSASRPRSPEPDQPQPVEVIQHLVGFDLAVLKLFDTRRLAPGIGIRAGGDYVMQRFTTQGYAPPRGQLVGRVGPVVRLEYAPVARLLLSVDVGADIYVTRLVDEEGRAPVTARVAPYGGLGLGVYLF